jgi:hypothetical protein
VESVPGCGVNAPRRLFGYSTVSRPSRGHIMLHQSVSVALAIACFTSTAFAAGACDASEHRQFDFWLGEWDVRTPDGKVVGVNSISSEYGACVLHERYSTNRGYSGESLNVYDAARKVWHQTWVDTSGMLLLLEGGLRGKSMVLEGQTVGTDGQITKHRITWTPNADGSVRQHWESDDSKGQWSTAFDGTYKRK